MAKANLTENEEDDLDLVPKRRAPPPPDQTPTVSVTTSPLIHKAHQSLKRPPEPPPPAPNVSKIGSPFR